MTRGTWIVLGLVAAVGVYLYLRARAVGTATTTAGIPNNTIVYTGGGTSNGAVGQMPSTDYVGLGARAAPNAQAGQVSGARNGPVNPSLIAASYAAANKVLTAPVVIPNRIIRAVPIVGDTLGRASDFATKPLTAPISNLTSGNYGKSAVEFFTGGVSSFFGY